MNALASDLMALVRPDARGQDVRGQGAATSPAGDWFAAWQQASRIRLASMRLPTLRDEDWRFTDIAPIRKQAWRLADPVTMARHEIEAWHLPEAGARLVFVNGRYDAGLSDAGALPPGVFAGSLHAAGAEHIAALQACCTGMDFDAAFPVLNAAWLSEVAILHVSAGTQIAQPIHLLFVTRGVESPSAEPLSAQPRLVVVLERTAEVTLVEDHVTRGHAATLTNAVTQMSLGQDSGCTHLRVQRAGDDAFHLGSVTVRQASGSRYRASYLNFGARLSRLDARVMQAEPGADTHLDGLTMIAGRQLSDTHTTIEHLREEGTSHQQNKCIVADAAHAVFNGRIVVARDAQRINSAQSTRTLLLSPRAHVDTKPQLEILADDVKCSHGATVGQLDAEALFYLKSRGLGEDSARSLLTLAFADEILNRLPLPSLRHILDAEVSLRTRLQQEGK